MARKLHTKKSPVAEIQKEIDSLKKDLNRIIKSLGGMSDVVKLVSSIQTQLNLTIFRVAGLVDVVGELAVKEIKKDEDLGDESSEEG